MQNIHEILKSFGLEIPADKKAEFDKSMIENYKTVAEVNKMSEKLTQTTTELNTAKQTIKDTNKAFEDLKNSSASKEDWEKKYNDLVADNKAKEEAREKEELEAAERAEFDKYFADNKKEWHNAFIADGYFGKFKEAKALAENKAKTTADILHELTKDDATAFKTAQPTINLKGANGGAGGPAADKGLPSIF